MILNRLPTSKRYVDELRYEPELLVKLAPYSQTTVTLPVAFEAP